MIEEQKIIERLGLFMRNIPNEHEKEYKFGTSITNNTFFQKLVPIRIIENKFEIKNDDYLRSLLFIDYLVNVIDRGNDEIIRNYQTLNNYMKERNNDFSLNLEAIVMEAGLYVKEKPEDFLTDKKNVSEIKNLYDEKNTQINPESDNLKPVDLYYEAIGRMVYDLLSDDNKELLYNVKGKSGLKALVFTDAILQYLKDDEEKSKIKSILRLKNKKPKTKIKEYLRNGEYFSASIYALYNLSRQVDLSWLRGYKNRYSRVER